MTSIPEICMQYTSIFQTLRLEHGICLIVGLLIGIAAAMLENRR